MIFVCKNLNINFLILIKLTYKKHFMRREIKGSISKGFLDVKINLILIKLNLLK
jgi:hypothetical protein